MLTVVNMCMEDMNSATSFGVPPYVEDTTSRSLILDTRDHATSTTGTDISDEGLFTIYIILFVI